MSCSTARHPCSVAEVLEPWGELCAEPEVLFRGGPVSPDGALAIALLRDAEDVPVGFRTVVGRLGMLDLDTPVELLDGGIGGVRVYAGYAGWGADQLQEEIAEGSWYVVAGESPMPSGPTPRTCGATSSVASRASSRGT